MTVVDLCKKMTILEEKNNTGSKVHKEHLNAELKHNKITVERLRKVEVALDLPDYQLVYMLNPNLTPAQKERLEKIYPKR